MIDLWHPIHRYRLDASAIAQRKRVLLRRYDDSVRWLTGVAIAQRPTNNKDQLY